MRENDDEGDKERAPSIDGSRDRRTGREGKARLSREDTDQMRSLTKLAVNLDDDDEEEEEEEEGERRTVRGYIYLGFLSFMLPPSLCSQIGKSYTDPVTAHANLVW